ncbi:MAG: 2-oxo acid dehydrogenase subunit E2 [Candidatus Limivicinus sp.]|jgi:pyruvate/2-oxoglutarate dehydrogenase complex dihydrolipoamide acyltransferase (E2) component
MFGRRADGTANRSIDPIVGMTPVIMKQRCDAQVFLRAEIDYDAMSSYIHKKRAEGVRLTRMNLVVAAVMKALQKYPELNRFIMSKKIYERNEISISYTVIKNDMKSEATVKTCFPLDEKGNLFDVADKMDAQIEENKVVGSASLTDKLAKAFLSIPGLSTVGFALVNWFDHMGIIPRSILSASPFHTSVYITNTASIRLGCVFHHIYNFGTTSIFISMGQMEKKFSLDSEGKVVKKNIIPFGFTIDERICSGAEYSKGLNYAMRLLNHPELLEK